MHAPSIRPVPVSPRSDHPRRHLPGAPARTARAALPLVALLAAACECGPRYAEPDPRIVDELAAVDTSAPVVQQTPIVDIHTHTFNARYLPLRHIALGKRDMLGFFGALLSDSAAEALAAAIAHSTRLTPLPGEPAPPVLPATATDWSLLSAPLGEAGEEFVGREAVARALQLAGGLTTARSGRIETPLTRALEELGLAGSEQFLQTLMLEDGLQVQRYRQTFDADVPLLVSHMMDLGPVYAQPPSADELLDFDAQIRRMQFFQAQPDAGFVYFVAYNPFRDHWPDADPGRALRIVQDAIENRGAYGVKVYPPSGYRPTGNVIPGEPTSISTAHPRLQWEARYAGIDAAELDRRLDALFAWCDAHDVPVFAHCNTGEFEARRGYGARMSGPAYWGGVLEQYPTLRLCLGHAGGAPYWFREVGADHADWGEEVLRLCTTYPNVYCEVGVHGAIADERARANFVGRLREAFALDAGHPFAEKILYGTDWYMPSDTDPTSYLLGYRRAFLALGDAQYRDFFCRNALRYLDVEQRLAQAPDSLPDGVRSLLAGLVAEQTP